jgi:hypothetical protein
LIVGETIQLDIIPGTTAEELRDVMQAGITIRLIHSQLSSGAAGQRLLGARLSPRSLKDAGGVNFHFRRTEYCGAGHVIREENGTASYRK